MDMDPNKRPEGWVNEEALPISSLLSAQRQQNPSVTTWTCPSSIPEPVEIAQRLEPRPLILQDPSPVFDKLDLDAEECSKFSRVARQLQDANQMARAEDCREPALVVDPGLITSTPMSVGLEMGLNGGNINTGDPSQLATQQVQPLAGASRDPLDPFQFRHPGQLRGVGEMHLGERATLSSFDVQLPGMSDSPLDLEPHFGISPQASTQRGVTNQLSNVGEAKMDFPWEDQGPPLSGSRGRLTSWPRVGVAKPPRSSRRGSDSKRRVDFRQSARRRNLEGAISADDAMGVALRESRNPSRLSHELLLEQILDQLTAPSEETKDPGTKGAKDASDGEG